MKKSILSLFALIAFGLAHSAMAQDILTCANGALVASENASKISITIKIDEIINQVKAASSLPDNLVLKTDNKTGEESLVLTNFSKTNEGLVSYPPFGSSLIKIDTDIFKLKISTFKMTAPNTYSYIFIGAYNIGVCKEL